MYRAAASVDRRRAAVVSCSIDEVCEDVDLSVHGLYCDGMLCRSDCMRIKNSALP